MVVQEIKDAFPLNVPIPQEDIKNQLQDIYKRYGIDYKVKKNTVEDYYDASPSYHKKPYTYTLKAIKENPPKHSNKGIINDLLEGTPVDGIDF